MTAIRSNVAHSVQATPQPYLRHSKLKELVWKQILATRLEKVRQQHLTNLSDSIEKLKHQFETKSQEARERLVS